MANAESPLYIFFFPIFSIYLETNSSCTILSVNDRLNCSRKLECFGKLDTSSSHSSALSSPSQDLLPVSRTFLLYHRLHWTFGLLMSATEHFLSHQFRSSFLQKSDVFSFPSWQTPLYSEVTKLCTSLTCDISLLAIAAYFCTERISWSMKIFQIN